MNKTKIRALILDYGGVISKPQNSENVKNILQILGQNDNNFKEIYQAKRDNYDSGQLSGRAYWASVFQYYGLEQDSSAIAGLIQEDVKSWTHLNDSMVKFLQENRPKLCGLAIISNMTRDTLAFMNKNFQWLELFDALIYSCHFGINKPDRRIYKICLDQLQLPPNECLFVDDSVGNVDGAIQAGMHAIHFKSFSEFLLKVTSNFRFSQ